MSDPVKDAWDEVAEGFSQLGHAMKDRYRGSDPTRGNSPGGSVAAEDGLLEALERLVAAGRDVGQRAVDVVRDAEINAQAKHAASSLNDALSATVDMIGREVAGWFARPVTGPDEVAPEVDPAGVDPDDGPTI